VPANSTLERSVTVGHQATAEGENTIFKTSQVHGYLFLEGRDKEGYVLFPKTR